jgi:molybdate/tungstate transport system substrate-binding protein
MPRLVALLAASLILAGCKSDRKEVVVLTAASLTRAFAELEQQLEQRQPAVDVRLEIGGSQELCRKVAELGGKADVLAVADYRVIDRICRPGHASFNVHFTTNAVVLAHMEHSRHTEQITADNWFELLLRPDVRLGLVDPDLAPIGYRTLLVWRLAELELGQDRVGPDLGGRLRARVAPEHLVPHEAELLQLLQSRAVDYAFVYRSTAEEHNLKLVPLPASYNLGAADRAEGYARATLAVKLKGGAKRGAIRGAPVVYGVTIPHDPPNAAGAELFLRTLLGETGRRALQRTGFAPLVPARCAERDRLPASLKPLTRAP